MAISAERLARHDAGEWMDWKNDEAVVRDDRLYEAEMTDGTTQPVRSVVYGENEADLTPEDDNGTSVAALVLRLRLIE